MNINYVQQQAIMLKLHIKDARSVSLYSYKRSQILKRVRYTKSINIANGIAKLCDKKCVFRQKVKTQQQQNKISNIQTLVGAGTSRT